MKKVLSFDIGGTKIAHAIVNKNGEFCSDICKNPTSKSADEIINLFKATIAENYNKIDGVAFSTAGAVNLQSTAITSFTGNMPCGYNKIDFSSITDKPILVENDANSAAWAEYCVGEAKGLPNNITLVIGTGVGSGIIVDGKLLKGKSGAAGEMHFPIDSGEKRHCKGCGMFDCFESFASGTGLKITAEEIMGKGTTTFDVIREKNNNNPLAIKVFDIWQNYLCKGLIMLSNLFDPQIIVLSGSMGQFVEYEKLQNKINQTILTQPIQLKPAKLANDAGLLGAALLLLHKL